MKHIVVFASGSGTNFQAIIDAVQSGQLQAEISGLITDRNEIEALERARSNDIDTRILPPSEFASPPEYRNAMLQQLERWEPDLIVLAGYLRKVPDAVLDRYPGRIINIHPALLPRYGGKGFYGLRVHRAVLENGDRESGCTVHIVTPEYDRGPILAQEHVPVEPDDTPESLAARVLEQEHRLLPQVIRDLLHHQTSNS